MGISGWANEERRSLPFRWLENYTDPHLRCPRGCGAADCGIKASISDDDLLLVFTFAQREASGRHRALAEPAWLLACPFCVSSRVVRSLPASLGLRMDEHRLLGESVMC